MLGVLVNDRQGRKLSPETNLWADRQEITRTSVPLISHCLESGEYVSSKPGESNGCKVWTLVNGTDSLDLSIDVKEGEECCCQVGRTLALFSGIEQCWACLPGEWLNTLSWHVSNLIPVWLQG